MSVHLRDVETLDDLADVTAPGPVEPGDLVACADELYRVEVVLWTPPGEACVPALAQDTGVPSWQRRGAATNAVPTRRRGRRLRLLVVRLRPQHGAS